MARYPEKGMGLLQACRHDSGGPGIPAVIGIQMPAGEKGALGLDHIFYARAANGHAATAPPRRVMNSRRVSPLMLVDRRLKRGR